MKLLRSKPLVLLSAVPIVMVATYIYRFGVNFPFYDQWGVVELLMEQSAGQLTLARLLSQTNEHRPLFP